MQEFRRRYNAIVRSCPYNHARVDYLMARPSSQGGKKLAANLRYAADVYGLYGLCLAGPPLLLALLY